MTEPSDQVGAPAVGVDTGPALLHVLRARGMRAPRHVHLEWADKYRGAFDDGWDALRQRTFERQKELGVVPQDAELHLPPRWSNPWSPVQDMEVYAGFLEHTNSASIGRLVDALGDLDELDNTSSTSSATTALPLDHVDGSFNEYLFFNGAAALETPEFLASRIDDLGTPAAYNHFSVGWAHAMDTPLQWTKQVASHWGGTRNATVVHWPQGIDASGGVRNQFHHVIDIAPTVLEAAGLPQPTHVNGVAQDPLHGVGMGYSFNDQFAADRHQTEYFEIGGNRGIYHQGGLPSRSTRNYMVASRVFFRLRRRRVGTLRTQRLGPRPTRPCLSGSPNFKRCSSSKRRSTTCAWSRIIAWSASTLWPPHAGRWDFPNPLRGHGPAHRGCGAEPQEHLTRRGGGDRCSGRRGKMCHRSQAGPLVAGACTSAMTAFPSTATTSPRPSTHEGRRLDPPNPRCAPPRHGL